MKNFTTHDQSLVYQRADNSEGTNHIQEIFLKNTQIRGNLTRHCRGYKL